MVLSVIDKVTPENMVPSSLYFLQTFKFSFFFLQKHGTTPYPAMILSENLAFIQEPS